MTLSCGGTSLGGGTAAGKDLAPGSYQLTVPVDVANKPVTIPLGTLVITRDGEPTIE